MNSLIGNSPTTTLIAFLVYHAGLLSAQTNSTSQIEAWVTNPDRSSLFQKAPKAIAFRNGNPRGAAIVIDAAQSMQSIDGFGFTLTGGSAELLTKMSRDARSKILKQLFASDENNLGVSYLWLSIGASDMNSFVFSYDDLASGETDFELRKFDLGQDRKDVIPVLKEILEIAPNVKILGSPWSVPARMKSNNNVRGGTLKEECYPVYAVYLARYVQEMKKEGITIDAITIQNEPLNSKNTPSMQWMVNQAVSLSPGLSLSGFCEGGPGDKVDSLRSQYGPPRLSSDPAERPSHFAIRRWHGISQLRRRHGSHEQGSHG
jgi:glucosylceramidase